MTKIQAITQYMNNMQHIARKKCKPARLTLCLLLSNLMRTKKIVVTPKSKHERPEDVERTWECVVALRSKVWLKV